MMGEGGHMIHSFCPFTAHWGLGLRQRAMQNQLFFQKHQKQKQNTPKPCTSFVPEDSLVIGSDPCSQPPSCQLPAFQ